MLVLQVGPCFNPMLIDINLPVPDSEIVAIERLMAIAGIVNEDVTGSSYPPFILDKYVIFVLCGMINDCLLAIGGESNRWDDYDKYRFIDSFYDELSIDATCSPQDRCILNRSWLVVSCNNTEHPFDIKVQELKPINKHSK